MTITHKQALYIAIYLYKGIAEKGYHDISIQIADNAAIGFEKKGGSRFHIYVRVNNRYDKSARGSILSLPVEDYNSLAEEVKTAIENSNMLDGVILNMSKVPNPSMEVLKQIGEPEISEDNSVIEEPIQEPDDEYLSPVVHDNNFTIEDFSGTDDNTPDEKTHSDYISLEDVEQEQKITHSEETSYPDYNKDVISESNAADKEIMEDSSDDEYMEDIIKNHESYENSPNEISDTEKNISEKDCFMDAMADKTAADTSASLLKEYHAEHEHSLDMIRNHSYINCIMKDGFDLTPNVESMFQCLSEKCPEKAVDVYINLVCHLVSEYDYDISKMSQSTGVDRRDIMLAMMEKQFN